MNVIRFKIVFAMVIAIGISSLLSYYSDTDSSLSLDSQYHAPRVDLTRLANDLTQQTNEFSNSITTSLLAIRLPTFELPGYTPYVQVEPELPTEPAIDPIPFEPEDPVVIPVEQPTSTPAQLPTDIPVQIPTTAPSIPQRPTMPPVTKAPAPTKTPVPTKVPKPTVATYPPITENKRPGSSLREIFSEVEKRACVPAALMMAIKSVETGERFKNDSAKTIEIYNTYGWWKTGTGDPCYGYGYHTQIGIVPQDSVSPGMKCSGPVGSATNIQIMGILQVSQWEQDVTRKSTITHVPGDFDRRVLFDNALIFAYATKGRVAKSPQPSCTDWPMETVKLAAEKHHGVCKYDYGTGNAGDYCQKIWDLYRSFK